MTGTLLFLNTKINCTQVFCGRKKAPQLSTTYFPLNFKPQIYLQFWLASQLRKSQKFKQSITKGNKEVQIGQM